MVNATARAVVATLGLRTLVWAGILAAFAVVLDFVPLFDVLGYDFSFALGLPVAFAAVDVGHGAGAQARTEGASLRRALLTAAVRAAALLVLPLLASLANAFRVQNCSVAAGLVFFGLLPVSTALYAALAGALVGLHGRRASRLCAWALPVFSLVWTLLRLYFDPPVFALDPFGGYFPGPIYDEAMTPPARLFQFRAANALWIATAVAIAAAIRTRRALLLALAAAGVVASAVVFHQRGALAFHVTKEQLVKVLRARLTTKHFVVQLDPAAAADRDEMALLTEDLEFRFEQLSRILGATPKTPVTVYLFPSAEAKKQWVGAGSTLYARPWSREIFMHAERFPSRRLRHELAHVFAGAFGDRLFGIALAWRFVGPIPIPRLASGLVEGLAEAADFGDPDGRTTVHQDARAIVMDGRAPPLRSVVGAGFSALSGARAYTIAGSFTHFLLVTRGPDKLRALYASAGDFEAAYGQSVEALEAEWRAFLDKQPLDAKERARAKERFRRGAIFGRVCARDLAARVESARAQLWSAPEEAIALLDSVCRDDPGEPVHRLDLAEARASAGDSAGALRLTDGLEADTDVTDPVRARAVTLAATLHVHGGATDKARAALARAADLATDDGDLRALFVKRRALDDEAARATIGRVMFGESPSRGVDPALTVYLVTRFMEDTPDEALGPYLLARQLSSRDLKLALPLLERACPLDATALSKPLSPLFVKECERLTAETAYRAGDRTRAQAAQRRLLEHATTEAERLRARDFLERLAR